MGPVDAHILLHRDIDTAGLTIEIAAAPPQPLTWRLEVESRTTGGANHVRQAGKTDGAAGRPLAFIGLSAAAAGEAKLVVRDLQGQTVAARNCTFQPGKPLDCD